MDRGDRPDERGGVNEAGGVGDPERPQSAGVGDSPLRPDEYEAYRTDQAAGDGSEDDVDASPGSEPRPWMMLGLALLVAFLAILAWAILAPLL